MFKNFAILLLGTVLSYQAIIPGNDGPQPGIVVRAEVLSVHDADTIRVKICKTFSVRLIDCWAAELDSKDPKEKEKALAGKKFLEEILKKATDVTVTIPANDDITKSFTFGRLLGTVYARIDDKWININQLLIEKGYATKTKEKK